jgi:hypothetical protein
VNVEKAVAETGGFKLKSREQHQEGASRVLMRRQPNRHSNGESRWSKKMRPKMEAKMENYLNSFFRGQEVVCIDDRFSGQIWEWTSCVPGKGIIYSIRSIVRGNCLYSGKPTIGLSLHGLPTIEDRLVFRADRFALLLKKFDESGQATARELVAPRLLSPPIPVPATNRLREAQLSVRRLVAASRRVQIKQRPRLIENAAIKNAVLKAVAQERRKAAFNLFGRGHEPRVSLSVCVAAVLRDLDIPRVRISGWGPNYFYPRRVFVTAIKILRRKFRRSPIKLGYKVYRV